jgi:predicted AlkP superfamily phosphohydrolase/phosphomutase
MTGARAGSDGRRLLVIGLDGATFRLLDPWVAAGELPELARLMAHGCHGELTSTFPPLTPPAWSSFMTGKNPGSHGIFAFRQTAATSYQSGEPITARLLRARTLWELVNDAGLPIGAINVPPSFPVRDVEGFMVACMFAPPGEQAITHPPELRDLLGEDYVINVKPPGALRVGDPAYAERARGYLRQLRANAERRLRVTLRLMRERPWALLAVIFYEPDRIQHFFWDHLTGTGPRGIDPALAIELAEDARAVFQILDQAVGELVQAAGPQAVTFVVSDHGFGPGPLRCAHVNRWLVEHGWLRMHGSWRWRRWMVKQLPRRLKARYKTTERILVDFSKTAAWCEVFETRSAGIWLNVRGRQPEGWISPGDEYESLRERLCGELRQLRENGSPVFTMVARREEVYRGSAIELAPDILLGAAPAYGFTFGLRTELVSGRQFVPFDGGGYTGAHETPGIYVVAGPGVMALGRQAPRPIEALAPTFLSLLGAPIPDGMEAAPLLDLLSPEARAALAIRYVPDRAPGFATDDGWQSEQDRTQVEEHLRALGYIE